MTAFLLVLAAAMCVGSGSVLTFGYLVARHRRIRAKQVESLLAHMARHPAGRKIQPVFRPPSDLPHNAPCGAWIGLTSDGWWALEFARIAHVNECLTCTSAQESLPNRKDAA